MNIEYLKNGYVRLSAPNGIIFIPTETWYSEVVTKEKNIPKYKAYEE